MDHPAAERIREMARRILDLEGMELVHAEVKRRSGGWFVRVFIDREGGVTVEDCSRISRQLSAELDVEDPLDHPYTLQVSSPGLDRPLYEERDYVRFTGRDIRLTTTIPIDGRRQFVGRLVGMADGCVRIAVPGEGEVAVPRGQVSRARLEPRFTSPGRNSTAGKGNV